jgi:hypothetical protein
MAAIAKKKLDYLESFAKWKMKSILVITSDEQMKRP